MILVNKNLSPGYILYLWSGWFIHRIHPDARTRTPWSGDVESSKQIKCVTSTMTTSYSN